MPEVVVHVGQISSRCVDVCLRSQTAMQGNIAKVTQHQVPGH